VNRRAGGHTSEMAETAREIERKFEFADDAALPSFAGLDGVAAVSEPVVHDLDATYYDTADGRLAADRLALRRRRGGHDEGWHLKESVEADLRLETAAPLAPANRGVPAELRALVRSRVRGRKLVPFATIESRRTVRRLLAPDATVLAEVADDRVTGTALGGGGGQPTATSWREVEVELVDGDRNLLDAACDRLIDAGAVASAWSSKLARTVGTELDASAPSLDKSSTAGEVVTAHLREQVHALVALDPLVRRDEPDSVHKMRVATRRLRSALATFRRLVDRSVTDPIRDELRWLGGVLGAARDAEVIHARLCELLAEEPPALARGPVGSRIDTTMTSRYQAARADLVKVLDGTRYLRLLDNLDAVASGDVVSDKRAGKRGRKALPREVRRSLKRWQHEVDALEDTTGDRHDVQLHEVRKKAKRVRYAGEAVAPVIGDAAVTLAKRMEELQDVLGRHQDGIVTAAVILALADDAHADGEDTFTYGRLHAAERRAGDQAAEEGEKLVDDLTGSQPSWLR
jgi:CHAD domain-containing protein